MDEVFKALADPTRRSILDALFEHDGQTVQALCDRFPEMTQVRRDEAPHRVGGRQPGRHQASRSHQAALPQPDPDRRDRRPLDQQVRPAIHPRAWLVFVTTSSARSACHQRAPDMAITKHVYQIFIKATPEQVWDAIIEPSWTRRYFHGTAFDSPPVKGEPYRTTIADGQPAIDGVIEELDAPHRLVMTWHTLVRRGDGRGAAEPRRVDRRTEWATGLTRLRLEHGDLARSPLTWANVKDGWEYVLDGLKTVLETGESLPPLDRDAADRSTMRPASGTVRRRSSATTRPGR